MTNYLRSAATQLQSLMERDASEAVLYCRAGQAPFEVVAIIGRTVIDADSGHGFTVRTMSRDFVIRQAILRGLTPKRNDEIKQLIDGVEHTFVVNGDGSDSHFDEVDGYGVAWRIHTKRDKISA